MPFQASIFNATQAHKLALMGLRPWVGSVNKSRRIEHMIDEMKVGALGLARESPGTEEVRRDASLTYRSNVAQQGSFL